LRRKKIENGGSNEKKKKQRQSARRKDTDIKKDKERRGGWRHRPGPETGAQLKRGLDSWKRKKKTTRIRGVFSRMGKKSHLRESSNSRRRSDQGKRIYSWERRRSLQGRTHRFRGGGWSSLKRRENWLAGYADSPGKDEIRKRRRKS